MSLSVHRHAAPAGRHRVIPGRQPLGGDARSAGKPRWRLPSAGHRASARLPAGRGRQGGQTAKPQRNRSSTQRKPEQVRREQRARTVRIRVFAAIAAAVVVAAVVAIIALTAGGGKAPATTAPAGAMGPEGIVLEAGRELAPASTAATGQTVDGIPCSAAEQVVYHVHTHLAVYVDGAARQIPLGVGILKPAVTQTPNGPFASATHCYYWLHTHTTDGIIHIESPTQHTYTLGNFFEIWRQPLSARQVGPATGTVTAFVNGTRYGGDPRAIPLGSRTDIQLDAGGPIVPFKPVDWSKSQL